VHGVITMEASASRAARKQRLGIGRSHDANQPLVIGLDERGFEYRRLPVHDVTHEMIPLTAS
jgi:hypothetical protein